MKRSSYEYIIPAVLALALTISLGYFIPTFSTPYLLSLERTEVLPTDFFKCYADVNKDGISEIIEIFYNSSGNLAVKLRYINEATINQFNLPGKLTRIGSTLDIHDINGDGISDIFVCTEKNDSIYLTIIDDIFGHPTTTRVYALDPINGYNDNGDYNFIPGGIRDLNGDGIPEFVMAINGGYSLQPRRVYAIDYKNQSIMRSPISGAAINSLGFFDLDGDGADEILVNNSATDNFRDPFPYMDTTSYLMVLDNDLSFYKTPLAASKSFSGSALEPFEYKGERFLLSYVRHTGRDHMHSHFTIFDDSLKMVKERDIEHIDRENFGFWRESDSLGLEYMRIISQTNRFRLNFNLQFYDSLSSILPVTSFNKANCMMNLDGKGKNGYVIPRANEIIVIGEDLSHMASVDLKWNALNPRILISARENGRDRPVLAVQLDNELFFLTYALNRWFKYREVLFPLFFMIFFGIFYLLGNLQNRLVRKRYEKDRLISQLQLQSIKNQLDPHFTYNALNAVGSLIYKGEKERAYKYLKGLTDLLRLVSGDAGDVTWTLTDELSFVRKFLEIEKLRFSDRFAYSLKIQDELGELKVPKLSVLTFVENAIKHGLRHKRSERRLEILAEGFKGGLKLVIRDNGIGRKAAANYQEGESGKGIEMMKRYFIQFNEATGQKAWFRISDLFKNGNEPAGTQVEIYIA